MFDEGPYHTGGPFRPERQFSAAPVFEHVHFFLDNISGSAEGSLKEFNRFESRRTDFLIAETRKKRSRDGFKVLKFSRVDGKYVFGAANSLIFGHEKDYMKIVSPFRPSSPSTGTTGRTGPTG